MKFPSSLLSTGPHYHVKIHGIIWEIYFHPFVELGTMVFDKEHHYAWVQSREELSKLRDGEFLRKLKISGGLTVQPNNQNFLDLLQ